MYSAASWIIVDVLPVDVSFASPLAGEDLLLCALFGGVISGVGSGLTIRYGGAIDGVEVMAVIFAKKLSLTVGTFVMIYNVILYILCGSAYERDLDSYIAGELRLSEMEEIPPLDRDLEYIMLSLRTTQGIDSKYFERQFRQKFQPMEDRQCHRQMSPENVVPYVWQSLENAIMTVGSSDMWNKNSTGENRIFWIHLRAAVRRPFLSACAGWSGRKREKCLESMLLPCSFRRTDSAKNTVR